MEHIRHHLLVGFICLPAFLAAVLASRIWRLRHIPGPLLCHFTDLLRVYHQARGRLLPWLINAHKKHGTVVRIGPNCISVSDATKVPTIYTMHGEFTKADSYHSLRTWSKGVSKGSVVDMQDEKVNADMKRALRGAFAAKNVLEFDDEIDRQILALKSRLREDGTVQLMELLSQYQIDFFMKIGFGQESQFLEERIPASQWTFMPRLRHWHVFQGMPGIESFIYQSWFTSLWRREKKPSPWLTYALSAIQSRKACNGQGEKEVESKVLVDKYIQARITHPNLFDDDGLLRMVTSTVSAGFDTTPFTMNSIIFFLCKHPSAYIKLKEEIMHAHNEGLISEVPKWTEVNKLPYLDAVMKEAMRLYPFLNLPLEREVPLEGAEINGYQIPARTTIGCHANVIGRDKAFYGADADEFRPDRWFSENRMAMERNSLTFGSGKRMCIGLHLAELEIKKTIPVIIRDFDFALIDADAKLVPADGITAFPKSVAVNFQPSEKL